MAIAALLQRRKGDAHGTPLREGEVGASGGEVSADLKNKGGKKGEIINEQIAKTVAAVASQPLV